MAQRNDGTSPGKIWYGWQYAKGIVHTAVKNSGGSDVKKVAIYGAAAVGLGVAAVATIFIPFIPGVLPLICAGSAAVSARNTVLKFKTVKNHPKFFQFIKDKEKSWLHSRTKASLIARTKAFCKRSFGKISLHFTIAGKWLGFGTAGMGALLGVAGGLQLGGIAVIPAVALGIVGTAAAAVALSAGGGLIAATVLCALAIPAGIATGIVCRKATQKLKENFITHEAGTRQAPVLKSTFEVTPANNNVAPTAHFNQAVAPETTVLSKARQAAAEERARKRTLYKKNSKPSSF